jgi:GTPase SAR1 family protein
MVLEDPIQEMNKNTTQIDGNSTSSLLSSLISAQSLFGQIGTEFEPEQKRVRELGSRLASTRFHLAVLGQFKRGKSTLLNALIGEELLPSAIVPVTSVPTFLFWGPKRLIKVYFADGNIKESSFDAVRDASAFLTCYVTESNNPMNKLGVTMVEVEHPASLLQKGVVLIDTPGIGSTFQHNTEATLNFLPQCDAALFLVSADPPVTQVEIEFLKAVRDKVVRILFLMNKVDYLSDNERLMAIDFFRKVLHERIGLDSNVQVFSISARRGLDARLKHNSSNWVQSGMSEVEDYLLKFLSEEKLKTLNIAIARKAADILDNGLLHIRLRQRSLTLPIEDLEKRLSIFNQKLKEIDLQREQARDLLKGDQKRTVELLEQECANAMKAANGELAGVLEQVITDTKETKSIENIMKSRLDEIIPIMFAQQLSRVSNLINQRVQEVLGNHQEKANILAETIRQTASELFEIPYVPGKGAEKLQMQHKPYWVTDNWYATMSPIPRGLFERLLPRDAAIKKIKRHLQQDTESIVQHNISNLLNATRQNIDDTFGRFALDLDQQLEQVAKATLGAIQEAHIRRKQKGGSVSTELSQLTSFESRILELQDKLADIARSGREVK